MDTINIKIPSIPDNICIVESFIDNAKEKYNISEDVYGNIMVATTEAVNNAILHGNKSDEKKHVELTLILEEDKAKFIIETVHLNCLRQGKNKKDRKFQNLLKKFKV